MSGEYRFNVPSSVRFHLKSEDLITTRSPEQPPAGKIPEVKQLPRTWTAAGGTPASPSDEGNERSTDGGTGDDMHQATREADS